MAGRLTPRGTVYQKNALRSKSKNMLGQGQFSIYLPRRVDAEYYVRSPVKVKAEMLLSPEHLGGRSPGSIPCRARAEKLTRENGLSVVNVPIKIEAELLLTPGMAFSYKPATPQSPTPRKHIHAPHYSLSLSLLSLIHETHQCFFNSFRLWTWWFLIFEPRMLRGEQ